MRFSNNLFMVSSWSAPACLLPHPFVLPLSFPGTMALFLFLISNQFYSHLEAFKLAATCARISSFPNMHNLDPCSSVAISKIDFNDLNFQYSIPPLLIFLIFLIGLRTI